MSGKTFKRIIGHIVGGSAWIVIWITFSHFDIISWETLGTLIAFVLVSLGSDILYASTENRWPWDDAA